MRWQSCSLYAIATAIVVVGLIAVDVPVSTLLFVALVLVCPLIMLFLTSDMHRGRGRVDQDHGVTSPDDRKPTAGRRWSDRVGRRRFP